MRDPRILKELINICRPMAVIMCCGYSVFGILFVTVMALDPVTQFKTLPVINFMALGVASLVGALAAGLFILATFVIKMFLVLPLLILHISLLIYCFIYYVYYAAAQDDYLTNMSSSEAFVFIMVHLNGAYHAFIAIVALCLLLYSLLPLWKFAQECYYIREAGSERGSMIVHAAVDTELSPTDLGEANIHRSSPTEHKGHSSKKDMVDEEPSSKSRRHRRRKKRTKK